MPSANASLVMERTSGFSEASTGACITTVFELSTRSTASTNGQLSFHMNILPRANNSGSGRLGLRQMAMGFSRS